MTEKKTYVSVVLPLKLDWVPCYSVPPGECVHRGNWVKVDFSYKSYSGVVYECGITPDTDPEKIKDLSSVDRGMSRVTEEEMRLWKMVADYYLCSIGEVFKAAYPSIKISQEELLAKMQEKEREKRRKLSDSIILKIEKEKENLAKKKKKLEDSEKSAKKNEKAIAKLIEEIGKISENIIEFEKRLKEISLEAGGIGLKGQEDRQRTTGKFIAEIELTSTQQAVYEQALEISEDDSGRKVTFKVFNTAQRDWIAEKCLRDIEGNFQKLTGSAIRLEVAVQDDSQAEKVPYMPSEKAAILIGGNEEVKTLVQDLGLDLK